MRAEHDGVDRVEFTCDFLLACSGYYRYDQGFAPKFPGVESFRGPVVHPQFWPDDLDYTGKRVVVIGSGATAVTLVPAMAETAAHVTMLQRSPTYIVALPARIRSRTGCGRCSGHARVPDLALEERHHRHRVLPAQPAPARA